MIKIAAATAAFDFVKLCKLKFQDGRIKNDASRKLFSSFFVIVCSLFQFSQSGISYFASFRKNASQLLPFAYRIRWCYDHFQASILIGFFASLFVHILPMDCAAFVCNSFSSVMRFNLKHLHPLHSIFFFLLLSFNARENAMQHTHSPRKKK